MLETSEKSFSFKSGEVVLAKYAKEIFYAKILSIDPERQLAMLLFDDNSQDRVEFHNIFSVNETTADIICVVCRGDGTETDNDIVLCDICSVGYHQKCHDPKISSEILLPEVPWQCYFCESNKHNPYVQENPFDENDKNGVGFISLPAKLVKNNIERNPEEKLDNKQVTNLQVTQSKESGNEKRNEFNPKVSLNHADSSPFEFISKINVSEELQGNSETNDTTFRCSHHDMSNNNVLTSIDKDTQKSGIIHCEHSDIFRRLLSKTIKVNRVSPWVKEEADNLIVDEMADGRKTHASIDCKVMSVEKEFGEPKHKSQMLNDRNDKISKERFLRDLPRYNWLVERLKNENKLGEDDIKTITESIAKEKELKPPAVLNGKPKHLENVTALDNEKCGETFQNVEDVDGNLINGIKIVKVESLSKLNVENANFESDSKLSSKVIDANFQSSSRISQEIRETFESFAAHSRKTSINQMIDEIKTSKMAEALKPKILSECPSKQYSIPSTKDLETVRYDALSAFDKKETEVKEKARVEITKSKFNNNLPKQNYSDMNRVMTYFSAIENGNCNTNTIMPKKLSKISNFEHIPMKSPSSNTVVNIQKNISNILSAGTQIGLRPNIQYTKPNNVPLNLQNNRNFYQNNQNIYPTLMQVRPSLQLNSLISPMQNTNLIIPTQMGQMFANSPYQQLYSPVTTQLAPLNRKIKTFSMVNKPSVQEIRRRMQIQRQLQIQRQWIEEHDIKRQFHNARANGNDKLKDNQALEPSKTSQSDESVIDERIEVLSREIRHLQKKKDLLSPTKMQFCGKTQKRDYPPMEEVCSPLRKESYCDGSPGRDSNFLLSQLQSKYDEADEEDFRFHYEVRTPTETQRRFRMSPTNQVPRTNHMEKTNNYGCYNGRHSDRSPFSPEAVVIKKMLSPETSDETNPYKRKSIDNYCPSPNKYRRNTPSTHQERSPNYRSSAFCDDRPNVAHSEERALTNQNYSNGLREMKSRSKSKLHKPCAKCGQVASFLCSECRVVWYCSQQCQLSDWKIHKRHCSS